VKFKEERGYDFVFETKLKGEDLILRYHKEHDWFEFVNTNILIDGELDISCGDLKPMSFFDIQTAVNLMQILIKEGLV